MQPDYICARKGMELDIPNADMREKHLTLER